MEPIRIQDWRDLRRRNHSYEWALYGLVVNINNVREVDRDSGITLPSDQPMAWFVANVTVENGGDVPIPWQTGVDEGLDTLLPAAVVDSTGARFARSNGPLSESERRRMHEPLLADQIHGRLARGKQATGNIWFAVPEGAGRLELEADLPDITAVWPLRTE